MEIINLEGQRFGKLSVVSFAGINKDHKATWLCKCDCGNSKIISGRSLRRGVTKSCSCIHKDQLRKRITKHNETYSLESMIWSSMKQRCLNKNNKSYSNYGGRGITICEEWKDSFATFLKDMGKKPFKDAQIDRINNDGNYEPSNCRWTTREINHMNRRCSKRSNATLTQPSE